MNQTVKICNLTNLEASLKDVSSANLVVLLGFADRDIIS